jgi:hypothetical protein
LKITLLKCLPISALLCSAVVIPANAQVACRHPLEFPTYELYITSAVSVDMTLFTVTMPMLKGFDAKNNPVYYIVTDSSDCRDATVRGINHVPKLALLTDPVTKLPKNKAVQLATQDSQGYYHFSGTIDFSPIRYYVPGPKGFPATSFQPGSVGDPNYSPFVTTGNGIVINAPQVANSTGIKDFVSAIDYTNMTVTLQLVHGLYDSKFMAYLRMDSSDPMIAAFEGGTWSPNTELAPGLGNRFYADGSARQVILPVVNGVSGIDHPNDRQGLESGFMGDGDPFNVLGATPIFDDPEYSPLWDVSPVVWTDASVQMGINKRMKVDTDIAAQVAAGNMASFSTDPSLPINTDVGVRALGILSNCPVVARLWSPLP